MLWIYLKLLIMYENKPIKRTFDNLNLEDKQSLLENLRKKF